MSQVTTLTTEEQERFNKLSTERRVWLLKEVEKRALFNDIMAKPNPIEAVANLEASRKAAIALKAKSKEQRKNDGEKDKANSSGSEEEGSEKKKRKQGPRKCGLCGETGHNKRGCEMNPEKGKTKNTKKTGGKDEERVKDLKKLEKKMKNAKQQKDEEEDSSSSVSDSSSE